MLEEDRNAIKMPTNLPIVPQFFGVRGLMEYDGLLSKSGASINKYSTCLEWYMVRYEVGNPEQNLKWFENSKIFQSYCSKYKKFTPFMENLSLDQEMNEHLMKKLDTLDQLEFTLGEENKASEEYPDAAMTFRNYNSTELDVKLQINDLRISEYHRNNGFTKRAFKLDFIDLGNMTQMIKKMKSNIRKTYFARNMTIPTLRITEGLLNLQDQISRSYLHHVAPGVHLLSGTTRFPSPPPEKKEVSTSSGSSSKLSEEERKKQIGSVKSLVNSLFSPKPLKKPNSTEEFFLTAIVNYFSFILLPMAFALSLPVFLNYLVLEEESNLKKIMRMHGMRLSHYYISFIVFSFLLYIINNGSLLYIALRTYRIGILYMNSHWLVMKIFLAWGLSQISLAIFLHRFVKTSKSAILIGYVISISFIFSSLYSNVNLYQKPKVAPTWLSFFPQFSFVRIFYLTMVRVNGGDGYENVEQMDE